jgi:hypothetical protein
LTSYTANRSVADMRVVLKYLYLMARATAPVETEIAAFEELWQRRPMLRCVEEN